MVIHVHDEVLAHDSQANQSNVSPVKPGASTFTVRTQNSDYKSVLKIRHTAVHAKVFIIESTLKMYFISQNP